MKAFLLWLTNDRLTGVQGFSNRVAAQLDWTTANQITAMRFVLAPLLALLFATDHWAAGITLGTFAYILDFLDGAVARYQADRGPRVPSYEEERMNLWQRLGIRGRSQLGKTLDPLADKATYFAVLLPTGLDYVSPWLLIASLFLALALTLMRPIKRLLHLDEGAANRFGKWKLWAEIAALASIVLLPHARPWLELSDFLLFVAVSLACLSLAGHVLTAHRVFAGRL